MPLNLRDDVLRSYHDAITACHQGIERTYQPIRQKYFWHSRYSDIQTYVKSCLECQRSKMDKHARQPPLHPIPPQEAPFDRIHMDSLGPLKETKEGCKLFFLSLVLSANFQKHFPLLLRKLLKWQRFFTMGLSVGMVLPEAFLLIKGNVSCQNWSKKYVEYSKLLRLTHAVTTPKEMLLLKDSTV